MIRRLVLGLSISLLLCAPLHGEPRMLRLDESPRPEIVAALSTFFEKLADGDAQGAKAMFAGDAEQEELINAYLDWVASFERIRKLMPDKPAEEMPLPLVVPKIIRGRIDDLNRRLIIVSGDRASVSGGIVADAGARLRLQNGKWVITHLAARRVETKGLLQSLRALADIAHAVEGDIKAGSAKSIEEISAAFDRHGKSKTDIIFFNRAPALAPPPISVPPKWDTPSPAALVKLPGTSLPSDEVDHFIKSLPGLPCGGGTKESLSLIDDEAGIGLTMALKPPRTLHSIDLFANGADGCAQYSGTLPFGLEFSDTRATVEKKLGRPPRSGGGRAGGYYSVYPALGLYVMYQKESGREPSNPIHHLGLLKPDPGAPAAEQKDGQSGPRLAFRLVAQDPVRNADQVEMLPDPSDPKRTPLPVLREVLLDERSIETVYPTARAGDGRPSMGAEMTADGAKRLEEVTKANVGRRMAIVLEGKILVAPTIRSAMSKAIVIDLGTSSDDKQMYDAVARLHAVVNAIP